MLSNDCRAVGFSTSPIGLRDASCGCEPSEGGGVKRWGGGGGGQGCVRVGPEGCPNLGGGWTVGAGRDKDWVTEGVIEASQTFKTKNRPSHIKIVSSKTISMNRTVRLVRL